MGYVETDAWWVYAWTPGALPYNLGKMTDRDYYIRQRLARHNHDAVNSLELDNASETFRGVLRKYFEVRTVTNGTQQSVWLTDDGSSGGTNIFDTTDEVKVMAYRAISGGPGSDPEDYKWTVLGIGHDGTLGIFPSGNATNLDYHTELKLSAGAQYLWVNNNGAALPGHPLFLVVAIGKSNGDYADSTGLGEDSTTGTWKSFEEIDWEADQEVCTEEKMDRLWVRDNWNQKRLQTSSVGHSHFGQTFQGEEDSLIIWARSDRRGGLLHWTEQKNIAASSSAIFYLSSDKTSGGSDVWDTVPLITVLRGDDSTNAWDCRKIGHDGLAAMSYHYEFEYVSGLWRVEVYNNDNSSAHDFFLIAQG